MKKHKKKFSWAFTLVEILIVVAVIGLIAGVVMFNIPSARAKQRDTTRISDLSQLRLALDQYFEKCHQYPIIWTGKLNDLTVHNGCPAGTTLGTFISKLPTDPKTGTFYDYIVPQDGTGNDYIIHASLESSNAVQKDSYPFQSQTATDNYWYYSGGNPTFYCYTLNTGVINSQQQTQSMNTEEKLFSILKIDVANAAAIFTAPPPVDPSYPLEYCVSSK